MPLVFEVELVSFERQQHWTRMDAAAKIARAQALKAQGNAVFKGGHAELARGKWQKAMKMLGNLFDCESEAQVGSSCNHPPEPLGGFLHLERTLVLSLTLGRQLAA